MDWNALTAEHDLVLLGCDHVSLESLDPRFKLLSLLLIVIDLPLGPIFLSSAPIISTMLTQFEPLFLDNLTYIHSHYIIKDTFFCPTVVIEAPLYIIYSLEDRAEGAELGLALAATSRAVPTHGLLAVFTHIHLTELPAATALPSHPPPSALSSPPSARHRHPSPPSLGGSHAIL